MKPNDKPKQTGEGYEDPKLFVVIGDEVFPRTGLETAFVDYVAAGSDAKNSDKTTVGGVVCSCDKVRVVSCGCVSFRPCSCDGHNSCSCVGHKSCSCVGHKSCSCVGHRSCSCDSHRSGGGGGGGCRCAPVH